MRLVAGFVLGVLGAAIGGCESFGDAQPSVDAGNGNGDGSVAVDAGAETGAADSGDDGGVPSDPTLIAHWKLDETGGTTVASSVSKAGNGNVVGGGAFVPGMVGGAFSTAGGTSHVLVAKNPALEVKGQFTIAMWISLSLSPNDSFFYTHGYQFSLKLNSRRPQIYIGTGPFVNTAVTVPADQWHHVAATFDSGTVKLYLDGAELAHDETGGGAMPIAAPALTGAIKIGTSNDGESAARGLIDDVRLWTRALDASEIEAIAELR